MERRDEYSHDLTRDIVGFQFEEALKSPIVQQIVAAVNEEHEMNPDMPIDAILNRYSQCSVASNTWGMCSDSDGIYSASSPMCLDNKQQLIEGSNELTFIEDLNSLQLNSNKHQYPTINRDDLQHMDMSLHPEPSHYGEQSVLKKVRATGRGRKSRTSPASVEPHLHDHRYSNTPLREASAIPLTLDDPLAIRINEDISNESGILGGGYKDDIHSQYQQYMSDVFCNANDQKLLDVDFIGQNSVPFESVITDSSMHENISHTPYFTPPYSNNPSPVPQTTIFITELSPSPSLRDGSMTPSPASCSSFDSSYPSVAGPSSSRDSPSPSMAGPSKHRSGPRARPGPSSTRLRRLSSSSGVAESSSQRAKRMSLVDLNEEEKRNRIRDQNNDASRRYREKVKSKKVTLPQKLKQEQDAQEQLQQKFLALQRQVKVLEQVIRICTERGLIPGYSTK